MKGVVFRIERSSDKPEYDEPTGVQEDRNPIDSPDLDSFLAHRGSVTSTLVYRTAGCGNRCPPFCLSVVYFLRIDPKYGEGLPWRGRRAGGFSHCMAERLRPILLRGKREVGAKHFSRVESYTPCSVGHALRPVPPAQTLYY